MKEQFKLSANPISVLVICLHISNCYAHFDPAYMSSPKDGFTIRNNWMSRLPDTAQLSELALPGTHGSASFYSQPTSDDDDSKPKVSRSSANQALSIEEQLQYGIRVFEVQIVYTNDEFGILQGGVFLNLMFNDFLTKVVTFLSENPTEIVLIAAKMKQQIGINKKLPSARLNDYLNDNLVSKYNVKKKNALAKVGEVRGKFIVLAQDASLTKNCLNFYGSNFKVMDLNHLKTRWDLYKKWVSVKNHLELVIKGDKDMFYVTYLTGTGGVAPYFAASGHFSPDSTSKRFPTGLITPVFKDKYPDFPRVGCTFGICFITFEGTNVLTRNQIKSYNSDIFNQPRSVGIIMADFPGDSLIANIIENNHVLVK